ncbi:MAG: CoA ester lyase [Rhizobiaceae bacterium]
MTEKMLRSVLYVPASNEKALAKLPALDCDAVIIDLEDAVHPDARDAARETLRAAAKGWGDLSMPVGVRINPLTSPWGTEDLMAALAIRPQVIVLPKVEAPQDIIQLSEAFNEFDLPQTPQIWAMIETPIGILNAPAIAELGKHKSAHLAAFIAGTNDLMKETGVRSGEALLPWLMQIVLAARAGSLQVLDGVHNDFRDEAGFEAACHLARARGFDGKTLIHPAQIGPANAIFAPGNDDIAEAQAIIKAFALPENASKGVISVNGKMVERLHLAQAQALLDGIKQS